MFGQKSYCDACDRLCLDTDKIEEMIDMTENQKKTARRPVRAALLAAALAAAFGITASAADLPAVKEFFATIFVTVTSDDAGLNLPSVAVEKREERSILIINGEETDVTAALAQEGGYLYEGDGFRVEVDANGIALVTAYGDNGTSVSYSTQWGDVQGDTVYKVDTEGSGTTDYDVSVDVEGAAAPTDVEGMTTYEVTVDDSGVINVRSADRK